MRYSACFQKRIGCKTSGDVFNHLMSTLKARITGWDYFVNWAKVLGNIRDIEIELNTLNYLVGKEDIEQEFDNLLKKEPKIARLVPVLVACRDEDFEVLDNYGEGKLEYRKFSFPDAGARTPEERRATIEFARDSGFLALLRDKRIKSVVDYLIGVEVGLDSNGRKNRTGTAMEMLVEAHLKPMCKRHGFRYLTQATPSRVRASLGCELQVDISERKADFAVHNGHKLYLIETNFYGGGGSKLKSTAGEYQTMHKWWSKHGYGFIWITDGKGWHSSRQPLEETFNTTDYVLNLDMMTRGLLEDIIAGSL